MDKPELKVCVFIGGPLDSVDLSVEVGQTVVVSKELIEHCEITKHIYRLSGQVFPYYGIQQDYKDGGE
jgi:hypothetical protein